MLQRQHIAMPGALQLFMCTRTWGGGIRLRLGLTPTYAHVLCKRECAPTCTLPWQSAEGHCAWLLSRQCVHADTHGLPRVSVCMEQMSDIC